MPTCQQGVTNVTARILVCDDEAHIVRAAEFKLRKAGFEVITASDGEEGWTAVLEHRPDLVIVDCQMPYLTGLEMSKRIMNHEEISGTPVLMLTAKGYELSEQLARSEYGVSKIMLKPFSPRALVAEAHAMLATNEARSAEATL
ncbi:MAG TPA: response regulator transcription factor [Planctomycetaceae bacterium]|nr:response regulator transcription factor [Planctomycetaceae bacterium]